MLKRKVKKFIKENERKIYKAMNLVRDKFCPKCKRDIAKHKCVRLGKLCDKCKALITKGDWND